MYLYNKLNKDQLFRRTRPPDRIATAPKKHISKRTLILLGDRFLKELQQDYCNDLIKDTTTALRWLKSINSKYSPDNYKKSLRFNFKSHYDNLKPRLVKEAVLHAMEICRTSWSTAKRNWILQLIDSSLRSPIGKFLSSKEWTYNWDSLSIQI